MPLSHAALPGCSGRRMLDAMSKLINLRTIRKQRARDAARQVAHENSAKHGRRKAERRLTATERAKSEAQLDGHKREE